MSHREKTAACTMEMYNVFRQADLKELKALGFLVRSTAGHRITQWGFLYSP